MTDVINKQSMIDFFLDKGMITAAIYVEHFPPETDLISRKMAIKAFEPYSGYESNRTNKEWVSRIKMILSNLQPAPVDLFKYSDKLWRAAYERGKKEAERKRGKWVDDEGKVMHTGYVATCTACGEWSEYLTAYCPNCGADMRWKEDGKA